MCTLFLIGHMDRYIPTGEIHMDQYIRTGEIHMDRYIPTGEIQESPRATPAKLHLTEP